MGFLSANTKASTLKRLVFNYRIENHDGSNVFIGYCSACSIFHISVAGINRDRIVGRIDGIFSVRKNFMLQNESELRVNEGVFVEFQYLVLSKLV